MTKLAICGLNTLAETVLDFDPDFTVSIIDPAFREAADSKLVHARQYYPIDAEDHHVGLTQSGAPSTIQQLEDTKAVLDSRFPDGIDRLLVHCYLGQSRSTAMAIYILSELALRTQDPTPELAEDIVDQVFKASKDADPNMHIVQMAAMMFDDPEFGYALVKCVREKKNPDPQPQFKGTPKKRKTKRLFRV